MQAIIFSENGYENRLQTTFQSFATDDLALCDTFIYICSVEFERYREG